MARKRKAPKKVTKTETDPFGLSSSAVKKDWTNVKSLPFNAFHFGRVVVDEFTYFDGKVDKRDRIQITASSAANKWVLSGTPPVGGFADVKGIASFLGVNLGCPEPMGFTKKDEKDLTAAEVFSQFKDVRSAAWRARRHTLAQDFLDRFVRQNIAEIDEIPTEEHEILVKLPPAERAIF